VVYKGSSERGLEDGEDEEGYGLPLPTIILLASVLTGLILLIAMGLAIRYKTILTSASLWSVLPECQNFSRKTLGF
jgi:hypothetical protein